MINIPLARILQGHRTITFPKGPPPPMPDRFRGRPLFRRESCGNGCRRCVDACPTGALTQRDDAFVVDLGTCLFCPDCAEACPCGAIRYSSDYRLAVRQRDSLLVSDGDHALRLADEMARDLKAVLGRSLKLRQVSAGGCNACEADVNVLNTVGWDLGRFGIQFVASPRHADGVLVTGAVPENMQLALRKTYEAVPTPKIVIAVGACAISGGPFTGCGESAEGVGAHLPVDLHVPGCPPHPLTILDGLLRLMGLVKDSPSCHRAAAQSASQGGDRRRRPAAGPM